MNRNYKNLLRTRIEINERCHADMGFRLEVLKRCEEDTLFWFDNFAWTLDPRRDPSQLPFVPYNGKQIMFIEWLESLLTSPRDGFVDKPRDVGATAIVTNFLLKHWLFDEYFNARIGSRKEDYVDRSGDPDTLFYKVDYTLERLPDWMRPEGWNRREHRAHMRLTRPDNSNTITGESANPNFARGGRQTLVLFDEIGFWNYAKPAWESAGDVTKARVAMTTPPDTGRSSFAFKLLTGKAGTVEKFEFSHTDIPTKDAAWLQEQRERRSIDEFNREILKSYSGSTRSKVYASEWHANVKIGEYKYDPNLPLYVSWDFGLNDPTSMIWLQKDHKTGAVYAIDCYEKNDKPIDFFVPFVTGEIKSGVYEYTDEELDKIFTHGKWRKDITHYGDPSGGNRHQAAANSTIFSQLREHGIYVQSKPAAEHKVYWEKMVLMFRRFHVDEVKCELLIDMILSARYPERGENSQATSPINKPIHDESCLRGDTQIRTLGGWKPISELVGTKPYLWSYSHEEKRLVPTQASRVWKSGEDVKLIRVHYDDKYIDCTPDHRFMLRNGEYVEAQNLKEGDRLMPFYEYNSKTRPYHQVHLNDGSFAKEHRYVYARLKGDLPTSDYHIHHIDGDKTNNNPDNLEILHMSDHCRITKPQGGREVALKREERHRKQALLKTCPICNEDKKMVYKQIYCSKRCKQIRDNLTKTLDNRQKLRSMKVCVWCGKEYEGYERSKTCTKKCANERVRNYNMEYAKARRRGYKMKLTDLDRYKNHRVVGIEKITERDDVYDIEVPKYHNFVANGVVVHNSHMRTALEYFAINEPQRGIVDDRVEKKPKPKTYGYRPAGGYR